MKVELQTRKGEFFRFADVQKVIPPSNTNPTYKIIMIEEKVSFPAGVVKCCKEIKE